MISDQYKFVINDLQSRWDKRIDELKARDPELKSIAQAMEGLRALLAPAQSITPMQGIASVQNHLSFTGTYAGISVRWAVLYLLAEHATGPMVTPQIADALRAGGIATRGANFNSNVSAVLSNMVRERGEVRATDRGYELTETGREAWMHIKASPQMQLRVGDSSGV